MLPALSWCRWPDTIPFPQLLPFPFGWVDGRLLASQMPSSSSVWHVRNSVVDRWLAEWQMVYILPFQFCVVSLWEIDPFFLVQFPVGRCIDSSKMHSGKDTKHSHAERREAKSFRGWSKECGAQQESSGRQILTLSCCPHPIPTRHRELRLPRLDTVVMQHFQSHVSGYCWPSGRLLDRRVTPYRDGVLWTIIRCLVWLSNFGRTLASFPFSPGTVTPTNWGAHYHKLQQWNTQA